MASRAEKLTQRPRFNAFLLSVFAATGLGLAAVGLYGVMSFFVAQRTQELGVRIALGATRKEIAALVLSRAALWTAAGATGGLIASIAALRWIRALLYGLPAYDVRTLAAAVTVLFCVALAAAAIPSWRATRVDPLEA